MMTIDREVYGDMKREREHQDEGIPLGTDMGNVILYGTIAVIGVSVAYTAFKLSHSSKRKSRSEIMTTEKTDLKVRCIFDSNGDTTGDSTNSSICR